MKLFCISVCILFFAPMALLCQTKHASAKPDTVQMGLYINNIYDLNFQENSFKTNFWLWANYKNDNLSVLDSVRIENSKAVYGNVFMYARFGSIGQHN